MTGPLASLADVRRIALPRHVRSDGAISVFEGGGAVPFEIARVFTVSAVDGAVRGRHAHKECAQLLVCLAGEIEVVADDGAERRREILSGPEEGLLLPPMIWGEQIYRGENALLLVLCDRVYDEADYLRDFAAFKAARDSLEA